MEDLLDDRKFGTINYEAYLEVDKRLDRQECAEIGEGSRNGASDAAVLQRKEFANQQPRYRRDSCRKKFLSTCRLNSLYLHTQRERNREDQYAKQGNPVAVSIATTVLVVVNVGSEAGQGK